MLVLPRNFRCATRWGITYSQRDSRNDIPQALPRLGSILGLLPLGRHSLLARLDILTANVGDSPRGRDIALGTQQRRGLGRNPFWRHGGGKALEKGNLHYQGGQGVDTKVEKVEKEEEGRIKQGKSHRLTEEEGRISNTH